ncbi:ABC transporter substrate-binding protein [Actinomadura atramentaria]|uniref:ABC transporter substrate-binding protein n=1 Tax=Actinomadura atramentaria TaxID=1990 RepID=UPI000380EF3D|nr:ABC transporter substrate-binding protein [Actinomadura atramentaria]
MPETAPLRPGDPERIGPYRLTGLLGEGGQGSVFLAEDEPGRPVAVKLLHARFSGDPKARSRFAAELAVARRVAPFCTARVIDADTEGDRPYIVSEYIDGPSLLEVLRMRGPRSGTELDRLAIGTMTALTAIHEAGIVHRDFKPGNILLAPDGPRVIDFGIARALDATGTMSSTAVGTPAYMAPEQISGAPVGPEADVFAWGATMVYAASGRPAFGQDSIPAVMHRILNLPPDLGLMTGPLREIAADCLAKDPARRPAAHQVLLRLLGLAGSAPAPGGRPADMLGQGAAAAATGTFGHAPAGAPAPPAPPAPPVPPSTQPSTPPPFASPSTPPSSTQPSTPQPSTPQPFAPPGGSPGRPGDPPATPPPWNAPAPPPWPGATLPAGGRPRRRPTALLVGGGVTAVVALALTGGLLAALNLKDPAKPTPTPQRVGGNLVMAAAAPLDSGGSIDPAADYGGSTERLLTKQLFTGLTEVGPDGKLVNRLATSLVPTNECRHWTITVRSGTTFSNGEPVDAESFARGWARTASNRNSNALYVMTEIKGYDQVSSGSAATLSGVTASGSTLQVDLADPDCDFPTRLAHPAFVPAPKTAKKAGDATYRMNPIGNGPFKIGTYARGSTITLVRNPSWAFGSTKLDTVTIKLSADPSPAGVAGVAAGEFGFAPLTSVTAAQARTSSGTEVVKRTVPGERLLLPILRSGPLRDAKARIAVSWALDRTAVANNYGPGYTPATGIVPAALPAYASANACPSCARRDEATARDLAREAGMNPGTSVDLYTLGNTSQLKFATILQSSLQQALGWKVNIRNYPDYSKLQGAVQAKNAQGLILTGWYPDVPTGANMLAPLVGGPEVAPGGTGIGDYGSWHDDQVDTLLKQIAATTDAAKRVEYTRQAEKIALDDMAVIPVVNIGTAAVRSTRYTGLDLDLDGDPTLATAAPK